MGRRRLHDRGDQVLRGRRRRRQHLRDAQRHLRNGLNQQELDQHEIVWQELRRQELCQQEPDRQCLNRQELDQQEVDREYLDRQELGRQELDQQYLNRQELNRPDRSSLTGRLAGSTSTDC